MFKQTRIAKAVAGFAGLSMAFSATLPAAAATTAELQAQIAALMAQLSAMSGTSNCATWNADLTVGSKGSQVVALQQMLVVKGYLTMPFGVAYGYFGSLTRAAVARWQAANGISPAVGYFGPISRGVANMCVAGGTTGTPGTTTGGTTTGTGGSASAEVITTPGAEGSFTVTSAPVSDTSLAVGEMNDPILAFQVKASGSSDVAIQRVKLDLGASTSLYNKILSKVSLVDSNGKVLASSDLNSSTVIKDGTNYYITLSGFSSVVLKGATRVYTVKADVRSAIDSADRTGTKTITLPINGVRGVDGAGIDLYGPSSALSGSFTVDASEVASAALVLSSSASTPNVREVIAAAGSNKNEANDVALLNFDLKATKDNVKVTQIIASTTATGANQASTTAFRLYANGQLIASAAPANNTSIYAVTFSNLNYTIAKDATQSFSIVADVRNANSVATVLTTSVTAAGVTSENSLGDSITATGSATGNSVTIRNVGPEIVLNSKTITKNSGLAIAGATSSAQSTFNLTLTAKGGDVYFGPQASSTFGFQTYLNGTATTLLVASSTNWSVSSGGSVTTSGAGITSGGFKLSENGSVTIPVEFYFEGRTSAGVLVSSGSYAVGLESVVWSTDGSVANQKTTNFMAGRTEWRTSSVIMP